MYLYIVSQIKASTLFSTSSFFFFLMEERYLKTFLTPFQSCIILHCADVSDLWACVSSVFFYYIQYCNSFVHVSFCLFFFCNMITELQKTSLLQHSKSQVIRVINLIYRYFLMLIMCQRLLVLWKKEGLGRVMS